MFYSLINVFIICVPPERSIQSTECKRKVFSRLHDVLVETIFFGFLATPVRVDCTKGSIL